VAALWVVLVGAWCASGQEPAAKPAEKARAQEKVAEKPGLPFQVELLETHIRFEANGDSRKEVHTVVKLNNILGAREFARLAFDYNRSFQQVEIPLARITHANGGTSEVLPSAVTDAPNPAVEKYPAYQDVRVKAVRILGLQEGDRVEYRVVTTTTRAPLAPHFWLEHTFDRSGQILEERYELELPADRHAEVLINPSTPVTSKEMTNGNTYAVYKWARTFTASAHAGVSPESTPESPAAPDISLSTFNWEFLSIRLDEALLPGAKPQTELKSYEEFERERRRQTEVTSEVREKALSLTKDSKTEFGRLRAVYDFVATQIATVDLPLGATGFAVRPAAEVLKSGYGTTEDKYVLFAALGTALHIDASAALGGFCNEKAAAIPTNFKDLVILSRVAGKTYWLEPSLEVAPFGMLSPSAGKCALLLNRGYSRHSIPQVWRSIPHTFPFSAFQKVSVEAKLGTDGGLSAKVKYTLRGDNELLLRVAFHQTAKEKWREVAGLLALSDGFRGQVTSVNVSDPKATKEPFGVEYELLQAKFVDWSKNPVRIPALLPQIGLPELPAKLDENGKAQKIELGTPLDVETQATLHLPVGTKVETPTGTSVARDYATYASKYGATADGLTASRHIRFLLREIAGERSVDYNAFLHAVQEDQAQYFVLGEAADTRH
jgi:Domain of Unknown Function with PDB structure (DUF3857)